MKSLGTACILLLGAVATAQAAERVPIRRLLEETSGRPYECVDYDRRTDSCATLAKLDVDGDRIHYDIRTRTHWRPAPGRNGGELSIRVTSVIHGARYCTDLRKAEITVAGQVRNSDSAAIVAFYRDALDAVGRNCTSYIRAGDHYVSLGEAPEGKRLPDSTDEVWFFAEPKRIRRR